MTDRLDYFSLFNSHKSNERKMIRFEMMCHAKNIRKQQLIDRKMLRIIKYLGMLAIRPTASSSSENSNFSQKLHMSSTEAVLESLSIID